MNASCQCGAVTFKTPLPQPLALYICHCTECRRQTGSAFGSSAIFPTFQLPSSELLSCYSRPVPTGNMLCYFCRNCGTRLFHFAPNKNVASIKAGCIDGLDWSKAIHLWTNNAMVPIPESAEAHPRGVDTMSYSSLGSACSDTSSSQLDRPGILAGSGAGDLDPPGMLTGSGTCEGSVCPDELKGSPVI